MYLKSKNGYIASLFTLLAMTAAGCNSNGSEESTGQVLGQDGVIGTSASIPNVSDSSTPTPDETTTPEPTPTSTPAPTPTTTPSPAPTTVGSSCHSTDSSQVCLALKYVVYTDSKGTPVVSEKEAISNLESMNAVWKKCKIAFQIDEFVAADPTDYGLRFNTANNGELNEIRREFENDKTLLLVTTGNWNRSGSLGSTGANAWANMPGNDIMGVILEAAVGTYPNIIAHELGHYLNLDHYGDASNLMNPTIYSTSTNITTSQCNAAKSSANSYWKKMLR